MSRLARAAERLAAKRHVIATEEVTYVRTVEQEEVTALATPGFSDFTGVDEISHRTEFRSNDWLILRTELSIAGDQFHPKAGDQIKRVLDGIEKTYEVLPGEGDTSWRWADSFENTYRIHTKEIG